MNTLLQFFVDHEECCSRRIQIDGSQPIPRVGEFVYCNEDVYPAGEVMNVTYCWKDDDSKCIIDLHIDTHSYRFKQFESYIVNEDEEEWEDDK